LSRQSPRFTKWDAISQWLIRRAARRVPECLATRLEEEWLADAESRASGASRLRLAVGCWWAIIVIVNDRPRFPAPQTAVAGGGWSAVTDRGFGYYSLRSGTLFLILGLHAVLFGGLFTPLSHTHGSVAPSISSGHVLRSVMGETR